MPTNDLQTDRWLESAGVIDTLRTDLWSAVFTASHVTCTLQTDLWNAIFHHNSGNFFFFLPV